MSIPFLSEFLRKKDARLPPQFATLASGKHAMSVRWHPIYDSAPVPRPPVEQIGAVNIDWSSLVSAQHPAMGVLELSSEFTLTAAGWAIDKTGVAIADTTWYGNHFGEIRQGPPRAWAQRVRGTALSLLSDFSQNNYYHYLIDALGRYALYEQIAASLPRPDVILCPRPFAGSLERWVELLAGDCPVEFIGVGEKVRADRILLPSFPGLRRECSPHVVEFWRRRRFGATPYVGARKLYVSRRSASRLPTNQSALEAALVARGFEVIDAATIDEPETLFAQAKIVVGAHGAGLTDCIFSPRDALLVEIVPSDHIYPYYYCLAGAAGLRYAYIVGESVAQRPAGSWGPSPHNFYVDIDALLTALDRLDA